MPTFQKRQDIKPFNDSNIVGTQSVFIDTDDSEPWIIISHCRDQLSMSIENWKKLVQLASEALLLAYPSEELKENWEDDLQP